MPVIPLEAASLSKEQKERIVKEFTETASQVMHMPKESFFVFLKENRLENVGAAGVLLSDQTINR